MRNVDDTCAAEGPQPDGGNGVYYSAVARTPCRRKHFMISVAGLVAILGVGTVVTHQVRDDAATTVAESQVVSPVASDPSVVEPADPSSVPPSAVVSSPRPAHAASPRAAAPTTAPATPRPKTSSERIRAAREAAAKGGVPVQRPMPERAGAAAADLTEVNVPTGSGTLKVVSATSDLTGVRELAWVVDEGTPVGRARCTSTIRVSPDAPAKNRPTLLLCWITSATKSAYTIAADPAGPPSEQESVAAIEKALAKL